jgi:hypothetical protein
LINFRPFPNNESNNPITKKVIHGHGSHIQSKCLFIRHNSVPITQNRIAKVKKGLINMNY